MDWSKVLGAASLFVSIDNSITLERLRQQSDDEAISRLITDEMRKLLFRIKQTADIVFMESVLYPQQAAAAIKILENQLNDSHITPDTFSEFSDKEYTYATIRMIRQQSSALFADLSAEDKHEVNEIVAAMKRLADYDFYLAHYPNQIRLLDANVIVEKYADRNGCFVGIPLFMCFFVMIAAWGMIAPIVGDIGIIGMIVSIIVYIIIVRRLTHYAEYAPAKKVVDELKDEQIWSERFRVLHNRFESKDKALALQNKDKILIRNFFGDSNLLKG